MQSLAEAPKSCPSTADTPAKRYTWWLSLQPQWRAAFSMVFLNHTNHPTDTELINLWETPALRFVGPKAPYPNMNFELDNCSGLAGMSNLQILVLTNHRIEAIDEVATMPQLKSLFVNNNALKTLNGIEKLTSLEQVYAHINKLETLAPLQILTNLREVYVSFNELTDLNGITKKHTKALKAFYCLPNATLPDREVIRVEQRVGIRCQRL